VGEQMQQQQQQGGMPIRGGSVDMNRGRGLFRQFVILVACVILPFTVHNHKQK